MSHGLRHSRLLGLRVHTNRWGSFKMQSGVQEDCCTLGFRRTVVLLCFARIPGDAWSKEDPITTEERDALSLETGKDNGGQQGQGAQES